MPAQSNWKVTEKTLKNVNQACLDLNVKQAQLAELALQALTNQGSFSSTTSVSSATDVDVAYTAQGGVAPEHRRYHEMLDRILDAGGTYRTAIVANLEGWSRAVQMEDRSTERAGRDPETKEDSAARALAYADSALQRAKADREGIGGDEESSTHRAPKRGKR